MYGATLLFAMVVCAGCGEPASTEQQAQPPGNASPPPELTVGEAARIPPPPPYRVTLKREGSKATITWQLSPLENIVAYRIYRKDSAGKRVKLGETSSARFVDTKSTSGAEYTVTAVNSYGAESPHATATVRTAD